MFVIETDDDEYMYIYTHIHLKADMTFILMILCL